MLAKVAAFLTIRVIAVLIPLFLLAACGATSSPVANDISSGNAQNILQLQNCDELAATTLTQTVTVTPEVGTTPIRMPTDFKFFQSQLFSYTLVYPQNWNVQSNQVQADVKGDLFVATDTNNRNVFVTVTGRALPAGVTDSSSLLKEIDREFSNQLIDYQRESDRQVDGYPADVVAFTTDQSGFTVQTVQVIFVAHNQAWNVSYNASSDQPLSYCADFVKMLDNFKFAGKLS